MKSRKKFSILIAFGLLCAMISGCGNSNTAKMADAAVNVMEANGASGETYAVMTTDSSSTTDFSDNYDESRKLVTTISYDTETENFDGTVSEVENRIAELGGYIENSNYSKTYDDLRYASFTIRIPEEVVYDFAESVENVTNVTNKNVSVSDITLTYVDIQSRLEVYRTELESLEEMMASAEDIESMISVESRISEVQANIDSMESQIRTFDNMCSYSTIYLSVEEVKVYSVVDSNDKSVWGQMKDGFLKNLKNLGVFGQKFLVWFVSSLPILIIWALFALGIGAILSGIVKKSRKKQEKRINEIRQNAVLNNNFFNNAPLNNGALNNTPINNTPLNNKPSNSSTASSEEKVTK